MTNEEVEKMNDLSDFVSVTEIIPDIILDIRYYSTYNFVGERINGYEEPCALLTKEAAFALKEASDDFKLKGYKIKIFDAYRPQKAVNHFITWAKDLGNLKMKEEFYPKLDKSILLERGYIAEKSGHSRGSAVDLTLVDFNTGIEIDMGGKFDFFDESSCSDYKNLNEEQYSNRMFLRNVMISKGFKPLSEEWWHFSLIDEPFPNTYFNFPVNSKSLKNQI